MYKYNELTRFAHAIAWYKLWQTHYTIVRFVFRINKNALSENLAVMKYDKICRSCPDGKHKVSQPMVMWAMDIVGPLPITARGHQYILVMSDLLTKWVEAAPTGTRKRKRGQRGGSTWCSREAAYWSREELWVGTIEKSVRIAGYIHKIRTSAYHPQTDGQVERFNWTVKAIISSYVNRDHNDWDLHLLLDFHFLPHQCSFLNACVSFQSSSWARSDLTTCVIRWLNDITV